MKTINWNDASYLGLVERINREILHPLGLAMSREPDTGTSSELLVADDGVWQYADDFKTTVLPDDEVKARLAAILSELDK